MVQMSSAISLAGLDDSGDSLFGDSDGERRQAPNDCPSMAAADLPRCPDASEFDLEEGPTARWSGPSMSSLQLSGNFSTFFALPSAGPRHNEEPTQATAPMDGRKSGGARQRIARKLWLAQMNADTASEARHDYDEAQALCTQQ